MKTSNNNIEIKKLRNCYEEWKKPIPPQSNQAFIPLAGGYEFSPSFINFLGEGNTKNIQSIDDNLLRNITAALIEYEANLQARGLVSMSREFELLPAVNRSRYSVLAPDGLPRWGMPDPDKIIGGWTKFIQEEIFPTKPIWDVVASTANILDIHTDYLDRQYNKTTRNLWNGDRCEFDRIPEKLLLTHISPDPIMAKLIGTNILYDKSERIIGAIAQYIFNMNQTFCLAATNCNGILQVGKEQLPACFLNQHLFDEKQKWKIIFCQDIRAALILQNVIENYNNDTMYDILVTGHLGTNLESFPWSFFYGHDIFLYPLHANFLYHK